MFMRKKTLEKIKAASFHDGEVSGFSQGTTNTRKELAVSNEMFLRMFHENRKLKEELSKSIRIKA